MTETGPQAAQPHAPSERKEAIVIMGVAGCGKTSLGAAVAQSEGLELTEGDDFHSEANRAKMRQGIALTDADRAGWLTTLSQLLQGRQQGVVLTCSALKRSYRERLRQASPGLRFVFLEIDRDNARQRVMNRGQTHFFNANLVDSQFEALELPDAEPGVLTLSALAPLSTMQASVSAWLHSKESHGHHTG